MNILLNTQDLKEIDTIIDNFVITFKEKTTSISALAFCLQTLMNGRDKLKEEITNG